MSAAEAKKPTVDRIESRYADPRVDVRRDDGCPTRVIVEGSHRPDEPVPRVIVERLDFRAGGRGVRLTLGAESVVLGTGGSALLARVVRAMVVGTAPAGARPRGRVAP